tara:strand:- start:880 stop:1164 length:285 start_codon:yes stop_codon:yes gene_type:complete
VDKIIILSFANESLNNMSLNILLRSFLINTLKFDQIYILLNEFITIIRIKKYSIFFRLKSIVVKIKYMKRQTTINKLIEKLNIDIISLPMKINH